MTSIAPLTALVALNLPLGVEVDFSKIPAKGLNAPGFTMRVTCTSADGQAYDSGRIDFARDVGATIVCFAEHSTLNANGWVVSWVRNDTKLVVYGRRGGGVVTGVSVQCRYPVDTTQIVPAQRDAVWK